MIYKLITLARQIKNYLRNVTKDAVFKREFKKIQKMGETLGKRFELNLTDAHNFSEEKTKETSFDRHYVYHTSWAARCIQKIKPELHTDISSSLFFCGIVSAFCNIDFYDFRPAELKLSNLKSKKADLTKLHFEDSSIQSLSCMHTIEHIGLGRYGDPIDYNGDIKALNELKRVTVIGGNLLIVVPVGKESKIIFNAHRIYHPDSIIQLFENFELIEFTLIPEKTEDGGLIINPSETLIQKQEYGCGCFWFRKIRL